MTNHFVTRYAATLKLLASDTLIPLAILVANAYATAFVPLAVCMTSAVATFLFNKK